MRIKSDRWKVEEWWNWNIKQITIKKGSNMLDKKIERWWN
jgi:hypothetical protein